MKKNTHENQFFKFFFQGFIRDQDTYTLHHPAHGPVANSWETPHEQCPALALQKSLLPHSQRHKANSIRLLRGWAHSSRYDRRAIACCCRSSLWNFPWRGLGKERILTERAESPQMALSVASPLENRFSNRERCQNRTAPAACMAARMNACKTTCRGHFGHFDKMFLRNYNTSTFYIRTTEQRWGPL